MNLDAQVTAATNGAWVYFWIALAIGCTAALRALDGGVVYEVRNLLRRVRVICLSMAAHRLYWSAAIWLAPAGKMHSPALAEYRAEVTLAVVAVTVFEGYRACHPFLKDVGPWVWARFALIAGGLVVALGFGALVDVL